ncbi:hypothetical protein DERF_006561 [Dermatophagoides farinae]|uniref:CCHC-type domain-containing protein n=1 Tax=Dermatophagoides farinae TaxID=6954 RepID=A0A922I7Q6_DERFA|nr:hypothetical protein DERF_006561 [Dermatophagoides farinae]
MLAKIRNFEQLVDYIGKLYDDALHYDYNKIRKDNLSKKPEPPQRSNSTAAISMYHCLICDKFHRNNFECLKNYDVKTAADLIKTKRLCFKCLKKGHVSKNCHMSSKLKCDKCPRQHATEMHDVIVIEMMFQTKPKVMAESSPVAEESTVVSKSESRPLFYGSCNGYQSRMLLDNGSDISLIDENLVKDNFSDSGQKCTVYSSSPLGGTEASRRKVSLEICKASKKILIELFAIRMCDKNLIIIGTDDFNILSPNSQNRNIVTQLMKTMKIINYIDISIRHIEGRKNPADLFSRIVNTEQFLKSIKFVIDTNDLDFSDNNVFSVYRISSISVRKFEYSVQVEEFEKLESIDRIIDFVEKLLPNGNTANDRWNLIHRFAQYGHDSNHIIPKPLDPTIVLKKVSKFTRQEDIPNVLANVNEQLKDMQSEIKVLFEYRSNLHFHLEAIHFQHRVFVRQCKYCFQFNSHKSTDCPCKNIPICADCGMEGAHQCSKEVCRPLYKKQIERVIQITAFKPVNVPASHSLTTMIEVATNQPSSSVNNFSGWTPNLEAQKRHFHYIKNLYYRRDPRVSEDEYKIIRNNYTRSIRLAKRESFRSFLEDAESNTHYGNTFKLINLY